MSMGITAKTSLNELVVSIQELNKKYNIDEFCSQSSLLFSKLGIDIDFLDSAFHNPNEINSDDLFLGKDDLKEEDLNECLDIYEELKKKFNYEAYIKEGRAIRKKFLDERKHYFFGKMKYASIVPGRRLSDIEKLSCDYTSQFMIASWLDGVIEKSTPQVYTIEYEDKDGKVKKVDVCHHAVDYSADFIEAPLIDRSIGISLFDSFLLHSFYDNEQKVWIYIPVKFIISISHSGSTDIFRNFLHL